MDAPSIQAPRTFVQLLHFNWLACRVCGRQSTTAGGLHKHIRQHGLNAWAYYQAHPEVLRARIEANIKLVVVRPELGPCWEYQGRRAFNRLHPGSRGYCQMRIAGAPTDAVHRLSVFAYHGALPDDLVLHACDHPPCCNPHHLAVGDHMENMADRDARGRTVVTLDDAAVQEVRLLRSWGWSHDQIAQHVHVGATAVQKVLAGERRTNVPYDPRWDGNFIPW
jgi:hypothetical protein